MPVPIHGTCAVSPSHSSVVALLAAVSTSAAVRPQQGMAGVSLGMSKAQVRAKLGRPIGSGGGRFYFARVWVGFRSRPRGRGHDDAHERSDPVRRRSRFDRGCGQAGLSVRRLRARAAVSAGAGSGSGKPGTRATDFLIGHGRVLQLTVQLLPG